MTSPIVIIFTAITRPIKDALVFLVSAIYNHVLKPCAAALVHVARELIWKQLILNLLWNSILVPLGIIGAQLAYLLFKSLYYGPFLDKQILFDGLLGAPRESVVLGHPFQVWIPTRSLFLVFGTLFGLGLGLRNYLDLACTALRCAWYGPWPDRVHLVDGMFDKPRMRRAAPTGGNDFAYHHAWSPVLACVVGAGLGVRSLLNIVFTAPSFAWLGPSPTWLNLLGYFILGGFVGLSPKIHCDDGLVASPRSGDGGKYARCVASDRNDAWALTLGIGGLGLLNIANLLTVVVGAAYYGAWSPHFKFRQVDFGDPSRKMKTPTGKVFGCIFGLSAHGLVPGDADAYKDNVGQNIFGRAGAFVFGLVFGWRWVCDSVSALGRCAWFGAFPALQLASDKTILGTTMSFPEQDVWRVLKSIPGLFIGWRIVVDVLLFCGVTTYSTIVLGLHLSGKGLAWYLTTGAWEGAKPGLFYCCDGLFDPPAQCVMVSKWQEVLIGAGSVVSLGIGFRNILNAITVIFPAIWHGSLPGKLCFPDGFLAEDLRMYALHASPRGILTSNDALIQPLPSPSTTPAGAEPSTTPPGSPPSPTKRSSPCPSPPAATSPAPVLSASYAPEMRTLFGKLLGTTFGLTFGLKRVFDVLYVVFARGLWNGAHPGFFDLEDAPLRDSLNDAYVYQHWTGHVLGGIGGCVVGLRFVLLCLLTAVKGMYLGSAPKWTHAPEGWLREPPEWKNKYVGYVFGLAGAGYGLHAVANTLTLVPGCMWYGCVGPEFLPDIHRVGVGRRFAFSRTANVVGLIVGCGFGLRTVSNVVYLVVVGMWWGVAPERLTLKDAPTSIKASEFPFRPAEKWFGAVFGLGIGLYPIVVTLLYIPVASWYGCYPEFFQLPESISIWSPTLAHPLQPVHSLVSSARFRVVFGTRILFDFLLMGIVAAFSGFTGYIRRKPSGRTTTDSSNESRTLLTRIFHTTLGALVLGGIGFAIMWFSFGSALPAVRLRNAIIGAVVGAVLATAGLTRDVVLVLIGASLYLPLFAVLLLFTHQMRSVYKIARYVSGAGKAQPERYQIAAGQGLVSVVGAWGLAGVPVTIMYGVPVAVLLAVNLATVVVQRLFSKALFTIRGWPIESSTSLTSAEVNEVNEYMYAAIRMAKLGLRSDPVQGLRFYIRDLGLISPDERKLKVMYELFLDNALEVRSGPALRYTDLLMHTDQQPMPAADGNDEAGTGAGADASDGPASGTRNQSRIQAMLSSSSMIPMPTPPTQDTKTKARLQPSPLRVSIEPSVAAPSSSQADMPSNDDRQLPPLPPSPLESLSAAGSSTAQHPPTVTPTSDPASAPPSSPPPPTSNQDATILATDPTTRPAPPSFAEATRVPAMFARPTVAGAPDYEDLGPTAIQDLDEATGAGQFALRELVTIPPGDEVLELRFAENVDLKMLAKGFKPKLLVVIRRRVVGRPVGGSSESGPGEGGGGGGENEGVDRKVGLTVPIDEGESSGAGGSTTS
ncbi:hypothetical protein BCR44DRAFT_1435022 [Catenaria anguillulae PL171]|uniref:Uncharacterized protein n=1 Tax=Catenaria anguillulae PL171 TaxID=765915 RepID=A0A1Y2HMP5_9FUNG|nr:hypothetical protein BCR44DRAFT_1435022 [Catenaria anguillulae PL171]